METSNRENVRVLIAEDDYLNSEMIRGMLDEVGYIIVGTAMDGQQAVEMTAQLVGTPTQPDVVLMDIEMPDMNGIEATRLIQERCPTPVVMLTGYEAEELVAEASAAGAGAYLVKPPEVREMERAIMIAMARFDDMMALRQAHDELEARVSERTAELLEANERLKGEIAERVGAEEALRESRADLERSHQTLAHRVTELEALHHISVAMSSTLEIESLLQLIVELTAMLVDATSCSVLLPDEETGELVFHAAADHIAETRVPPGRGIAARVLRERTPQIVHDVTADPDHYAQIGQESGIPTRSLLAIPLLIRDKAIGVLTAVNKRRGRFTEQDRDLLVTLGSHAASAIENARLFEQAQQEIAERVRVEEELRQYQDHLEELVEKRTAELEQSNEEVKRFAYIVSHDLRAPLANLKGFAAELRSAWELIGDALSTALPYLNEKQRLAVTTAIQADVPEALDFMGSSVTRMDRFINALLRLSRLGRRELDLEPINMNVLVHTTLQSLAHRIEERQVKVIVGSLPEVVADRLSMEQIMGNILGNAVKYLDPGRPGEIEITAERSPPSASGRGRDETTFHVRDNGRGIAERDMDKVFAPFQRAGKQDVPGEGMGLAYVQALVRRHGGRLWCESEPGVGTTFTFTLPHHLTRGKSNAGGGSLPKISTEEKRK